MLYSWVRNRSYRAFTVSYSFVPHYILLIFWVYDRWSRTLTIFRWWIIYSIRLIIGVRDRMSWTHALIFVIFNQVELAGRCRGAKIAITGDQSLIPMTVRRACWRGSPIALHRYVVPDKVCNTRAHKPTFLLFIDRTISVANVRAVRHTGLIGPAVYPVRHGWAVGDTRADHCVPVVAGDALALGLADSDFGVSHQAAIELTLQTCPIPVEISFATTTIINYMISFICSLSVFTIAAATFSLPLPTHPSSTVLLPRMVPFTVGIIRIARSRVAKQFALHYTTIEGDTPRKVGTAYALGPWRLTIRIRHCCTVDITSSASAIPEKVLLTSADVS